ncbi:MAG TPA: thioredoxin-dependent thiol peroxidase [Alphaproteobacteria bacterium]|nr:thioredoxin-dependent thiol peroxidase [Alphaproteobacteria bacterium]USO05652.1 MAG: thioredoxin-dependent thiol peroxidase [Rhodospirillales bacterium]HOO81844.1 thioredoxin-dependent thiol peroxidase [Alphaproteobacteria bacterium]
MTELKVGDPAPNFTAPADGNRELSLSDFKGQKIVLYFYPKDDTPGCTKESCGFNEALQAFKKLGTTIIGISKDSPVRHDKFKAKYNLNFPLVSDENTDICERYGVWKEKNMYGKKYMGIERSTFLINEEGKIAAIWRKVKVDGHVEEVESAAENIAKAA